MSAYIPLSTAVMVVDAFFYPWRRRQVPTWKRANAGVSCFPEEIEARLEAWEFWLRRQVMRGLQMARLSLDGPVPIDVDAFRKVSEVAAEIAERNGIPAVARYYRGEGVYSEEMSEELAMANEALGCPTSTLHLRSDIGVDQADLLRRLERAGQPLPEVLEPGLQRLERSIVKQLALCASEPVCGRPQGSFAPIQSLVVEILVSAGDPELPTPTVRSRLKSRGVKFHRDGTVSYTPPRGGAPQTMKWASFRDTLKKRLRKAAADDLEEARQK